MPKYADPAVYPVGTPAATDNVMTRTAVGADGNFALGNLAGIAGLTAAADLSIYYNGTAWATYTVTAVGRTLLAATTQAAQRTAIQAVGTVGDEDVGGAKRFTAQPNFNMGARISLNQMMVFGDGVGVYGSIRPTGTGTMVIAGGPTGSGTRILLRPQGDAVSTGQAELSAAGHFTPGTTNAQDIGASGTVWRNAYFQNAPIIGSDDRLKTEARQLRDAEFKAFSAVCRLPPVWRWLSRVHGDENCEPEGRAARKHFGPTVQAAMQVFADNGLEAFENAPFCYDEWPAEEATYDEDGNELTPAREAGDRYSFRKEELLCGMVSALARESDEKDAKIEAQQVELNELKEAMALLMARVAALESR